MNRSRVDIQARQEVILNELHEKNIVHIADLCNLCGVTDMTIRRDLSYLASRGLLKRIRGGAERAACPRASHTTSNPHTLQLVQTVTQNIEKHALEKNIIAAAAAQLIPPGTTVFMNSGTTGLYILKYLNGKNIRIVSNNAAMALVERAPDTELTIAGGEHFTRTQSFVGPLAKNVFENVIASMCILSVSGISSQSGITSSCLQETEINNLMIQQCSGKRIVIADGSKVGVAQSFISCRVSDIDILITDNSADPFELENLRGCGLEVIVVPPAPASRMQ